MTTSTNLLGKSELRNNYRVEFYNKNEKVLAKVYQKNIKVGKCILEGLYLAQWTYENLPALARSKIDQLLKPEETALKVKRVFSKTKNPDYLGEDSDMEFDDVDFSKDLVIFEKDAFIPAISMTIPCAGQNIKGSTLIEIVHDKIQEQYCEIIDYACEYERDLGRAAISPPEEKNGVLFIQSSMDWFMTLGGWKGMMPSKEVKEYFFYGFDPQKEGKKFDGVKIYPNGLTFPIIDHRIHLPKGFSISQVDVTKAWAEQQNKFIPYKTDLSYSQIVRAIETIKKAFKWSDSKIANLQLYALSRYDRPSWFKQEIPKENQMEVLHFLDYLNGLMFGIEASGLNAALATGLMTLDLIAGGRFDYKRAFNANTDGGIYPYACFGNNRGTYKERERILFYKKQNRDSQSMKAFRKNPSLSPVATKEAILIKEWLKYRAVIVEDINYSAQIGSIERSITNLITCYFTPWVHKNYSINWGQA